MKCYLLSVFICAISLVSFGQSNQIQVEAKKVSGAIVLDGLLDDSIWQGVSPTTGFNQYFPSDSLVAKHDTEVYLAYDDEFIYFAAKCKAIGGDFRANSLKRDYGFFSGDNLSLILDTYSDKTNAFMFGMNSFGVRREALIANGGRNRQDFDISWDNKWDGESKQYEDYWICEMAIPFKSLRFKAGSKSWRINVYRVDLQDYEITTLTPIPSNIIIADLTYMSQLNWEQPLAASGKNISLIPYLSGGFTRDYENLDQTKNNYTSGIGGDAKIAITSGLNLDLTINPDFSQVEVDRQVTNLQRFEIFFPERRQFFLENADLFSRFGSQRSNPFFSRRIGISLDTTTEENIQNTILYGARLSGKLNEKLRVGLINMQTASQSENDLPSFNYSVLAAEQRVFDRSNIGLIVVNKQAINPDKFGETYDDFNRVAGIEYRMATPDNTWTGKFTYHHAFTQDKQAAPFSHAVFLTYQKRAYELEYFHSLIGNGFDAQVGFVPRRDIFFTSPEVKFKFYPQNEVISNTELSFDSRFTYKLGTEDHAIVDEFKLIEKGFETRFNISFTNSARGNAALEYEDLILLDDFDPTRVQEDDIFLSAGSFHRLLLFRMDYNSDNRKNLFYQIRPLVGSFYGGIRAGLSGRLGYRFQPFGSISVDYNFNHIDIGGDFVAANLWLVGPRFDFTFSKKLFFSTFIQYNNQQENININARLQWRFKPASDFFLVYTDNYLTEDFSQFSVRNRALVAKVTYWLNL